MTAPPLHMMMRLREGALRCELHLVSRRRARDCGRPAICIISYSGLPYCARCARWLFDSFRTAPFVGRGEPPIHIYYPASMVIVAHPYDSHPWASL
jgi:hypothetical protein